MVLRKLLRIVRELPSIRSLKTDVRVRFAPSPTGKLHLGGLRTALFNYLIAKSRCGQFLLRIEDTDQQRAIEGEYRNYETLLDYFGLQRDEGPSEGGNFGPYLQSQRIETYKTAAKELVDRRTAYYCFCSSKRLEMLRQNAVRANKNLKYDNHCRKLPSEEVEARLRNNEPYVIRFILQKETVVFQDEVFGEVSQTIDESDFVLLKSDGFPTYHLANVVDDHLMEISHVVRGMEWIPSTPKHIKLYKAFGWAAPQFLHLPLITRDGVKKLSKREKDAYADYYVDEKGYVPLAVLNFLIRNGGGIRNYNGTHLYTLEEMAENFDVKLIGRRNFMLDEGSLNNFGQLAFMNCDYETILFPLMQNFFRKNMDSFKLRSADDPDYVQKVLQFLRERDEKFAHLSQLKTGGFRYFFNYPDSPKKVLENFDANEALKLLEEFRKESVWNIESIKRVAKQHNSPYPKLMLLLRLLLIDNKSGPPLNELICFFGGKKCTERVQVMIDLLRACL